MVLVSEPEGVKKVEGDRVAALNFIALMSRTGIEPVTR
jgi:hypothetical protein